jgi:hypothetical protein
MTDNVPDDLVKTSDQLDDEAKKHDASAQEEDQAPGHDLESGADGDSDSDSDGDGEDTVSEEVARDLPGAAFQH